MPIRPETVTPDTSLHIDKSQIDAQVAHERSIQYFLENTELGILTLDQMGVMSLVHSCDHLGLDLRATEQFFENQRRLSSGEEGKGRIQAKEIVTAGAFPMSLLFQRDEPGILDRIKGLFGRKTDAQRQQGA